MGKMRTMVLAAMIAALTVIVTACGRDDNMNNNTTAAPTTGRTETESMRETGGVLQDMVDGVEQGVNDMLDGTDGMNGTDGANGTNSTNGTQSGYDSGMNGPGNDNVNRVTSGEDETTKK